MSDRITVEPRKTFETPRFIHQEWPEHIARCCAAIRARRQSESDARRRDGSWFLAAEQVEGVPL